MWLSVSFNPEISTRAPHLWCLGHHERETVIIILTVSYSPPNTTIITTILSCSSILFSPSLGSPTAVTKGAFSLSAVIAVSAQRRKRPQVPKHPKPQRQIKPTRRLLIQCCFIDPLIVSQKLTQISIDQPPICSFLHHFTICLGGGGAFNETHIKAKHICWLQNLHQNCGGTQFSKGPMKSNALHHPSPSWWPHPPPNTPASMSRVKRNGTFSGNGSPPPRSKAIPKSMLINSPVLKVVRCGWVLLGFQYLQQRVWRAFRNP